MIKKQNNLNSYIALGFLLLSFLINAFTEYDIITKYPMTFTGIFMLANTLFSILGSILFVVGIVFSSRNIINASLGVYCFNTFTYSLFYALTSLVRGFYPPLRATYSRGMFATNFLAYFITAIAFLLMILYSTKIITNTKLVIIPLSLSWLLMFSASIISGFVVEILVIPAYILLLIHINMKDVNAKIYMRDIFYLSVVTFGVYYIIWCKSAMKKTALLTSSAYRISNVIIFILCPLYAAYWFYTAYEDMSNSCYNIKNRGILCMLLALTPFASIAFSILQRDLNSVEIPVPVEAKAKSDISDDNDIKINEAESDVFDAIDDFSADGCEECSEDENE